ncbi:hypothetical protein FB45DRAFT_242512 [Roridomyces roridus]|uniref:Uncharacterized protein n=1 Tax=Roridomyces roridus TaxID=1738132 RepID=A0AAD7BA21_9AGAR|nr:hypothetical protein FB45DRAFT_242512 [Roridomyces roridus]
MSTFAHPANTQPTRLEPPAPSPQQARTTSVIKTKPRSERRSLNEEATALCRALSKEGLRNPTLAAHFKVARSTISKTVNNGFGDDLSQDAALLPANWRQIARELKNKTHPAETAVAESGRTRSTRKAAVTASKRIRASATTSTSVTSSGARERAKQVSSAHPQSNSQASPQADPNWSFLCAFVRGVPLEPAWAGALLLEGYTEEKLISMSRQPLQQIRDFVDHSPLFERLKEVDRSSLLVAAIKRLGEMEY